MKIPVRVQSAKKGDSGKVLVIGGSPTIHGAPILASLGALAAGVDLVSLALPKIHGVVARQKNLNFIVTEFLDDEFSRADARQLVEHAHQWADSVCLGCGFFEEALPAVLEFLQGYTGAIVLDAGALHKEILPFIRNRTNVIITPHAGEFQRLFGRESTPENVRRMAKKWRITILKKGPVDFISNAEEDISNATGCSEMSIGGTGDTLAGICSGFLAQKLSPLEAAQLAAYKWGKTGEILKKRKNVFSAEEMIFEFTQR